MFRTAMHSFTVGEFTVVGFQSEKSCPPAHREQSRSTLHIQNDNWPVIRLDLKHVFADDTREADVAHAPLRKAFASQLNGALSPVP